MLSRVDHHCCREGEGGLGPPKLKLEIIFIQDKYFFSVLFFCIFEDVSPVDLQSIFAGGFEEDAGEELGAGLHLEALLDLFALACEAAREKK